MLFQIAGEKPPYLRDRRGVSRALQRGQPLALRWSATAARVYRVDLDTGNRELWKELMPVDPGGVERISNVVITPDAKSYAYTFSRLLSDLFVVEGLK